VSVLSASNHTKQNIQNKSITAANRYLANTKVCQKGGALQKEDVIWLYENT